MRTFGTLFAVLLALITARPADAQLPVATGRQIAMSNSAWRLFIPSTYHARSGNVADLLVHFHGDPQTVWNNAQYANLNAIVVTVNYSGLSSAYSTPFSNAALFQTVLDEALTKVRAEADIPDTLAWDKLAVSSFSAGYGAVREILKSATYRNEIDALLAADSLYATTAGDGTPLDSQMINYKTFAGLAKNGSKTFLFSHSLVPTYTYESTQETGDELLQHLGLSATANNVSGLGTLNFYRRAQSGNFHLWGATGSDGDAHLAHLRYVGEFLEDLPLARLADFNGDGRVDAADYTVWRDGFGTAYSTAHYNTWQTNFGNTSPGSGAASGALAAAAVPEPASWWPSALATIAAATAGTRRRRASLA